MSDSEFSQSSDEQVPVIAPPKKIIAKKLSKDEQKQVKLSVAEKRKQVLKEQLEQKLLAESEAKESARKKQASAAGKKAAANAKEIKDDAIKWRAYLKQKEEKHQEKEPEQEQQQEIPTISTLQAFLQDF